MPDTLPSPSTIRVGVDRVEIGDLVESPDSFAPIALHQKWVELDGHRFDNIVRADWGPLEPSPGSGNCPMVVTVMFYCGDFSAVDARVSPLEQPAKP